MDDKEIGTVISSLEGPSPTEVDFVVTQGKVHRGQFVEIPYADGKMMCLVENVIKTNKYFERADSVKEFESQGTKLFEQFPVHEWEYLLAKTKPLGLFVEGEKQIRRPSFPPSPGSKVFNAHPENIVQFLGLDTEKGMQLGKLEFHPVEVKVNLSKLLQKHLAILAMSGSGKSYTVSCLLEELLNRKAEHGRVGIVAFDVHGEYTNFAEPPSDAKYTDFSTRTRLIRARDLRIGVPKISATLFGSLMPNASPAQKRELGKIIEELQKKMKEGYGAYDLNDIRAALLAELNEKEGKNTTIQTLLGWLYELEELHLFGKADNPSLLDLVQPGILTVVDLNDVLSQKKKQVIVSYLANRLFNERRSKTIPLTVIVLEEAHNFIPQNTPKEGSMSKYVFRTIAREGRKFGVSLCLISQRPVQLDTTTLSQCNTQLLLRITNPYDIKHIGESSEGLSGESASMLNSLRVGEGVLVGEAVNAPVFFKVRERKSQPSKHEGTLEKAGIDYEVNAAKNRKETEDLL
ncbi:MAG: ATP-binding protein [Candidatus Iainarchaeum archaeon]|uniref:ATP-binding protein n=1 Tax=Candidatus Iainarchaeum sp. TaxID=3101447 RepID=A0A7T9DJV3_9ARCH|nr:MAG: ATP-binding protein [Candidatus Diapherotrites archaeon]